MWNYAELSKMANEYGGPEKYVEAIKESGMHDGEMKMLPWVGVAAIASPILIKCISMGNDYFKSKRAAESKKEAVAEKELINGIKEYDSTHKQNEINNHEEEK